MSDKENISPQFPDKGFQIFDTGSTAWNIYISYTYTYIYRYKYIYIWRFFGEMYSWNLLMLTIQTDKFYGSLHAQICFGIYNACSTAEEWAHSEAAHSGSLSALQWIMQIWSVLLGIQDRMRNDFSVTRLLKWPSEKLWGFSIQIFLLSGWVALITELIWPLEKVCSLRKSISQRWPSSSPSFTNRKPIKKKNKTHEITYNFLSEVMETTEWFLGGEKKDFG